MPTDRRLAPKLDLPGLTTQTQASVTLDFVRGAAALVVLFDHWHHLFFVDYGQLNIGFSRHPLVSALYLVTSAGHQAVVIFFVLSGYLISKSVLKTFARNDWGWTTYLLNRLTRLWIVLIPALLLTAVLDHIGMGIHLPEASAIYAGRGGSRIISDVSLRTSFAIGLGNLAFLQTILVPTFGSDGALWSLANEFWYYILFPLTVLAIRRNRGWFIRLLYGSTVLTIAYFLKHGVIQGFPIWLLGTGLASVSPAKVRIGKVTSWLCFLTYVPIFYFFSKFNGLPAAYSDFILGLFTVVLLWVVISSGSRPAPDNLSTRGIRTLSRFSYTLYLVHIPALTLAAACLLNDSRWLPDTRHTIEAFGVLVVVVSVAFLLATVTEFKTESMRRFVEGWRISLGLYASQIKNRLGFTGR
jgi:peptidoglycan/LPS O-acetylase OafA/YrhL